jgi:hypothetical protein
MLLGDTCSHERELRMNSSSENSIEFNDKGKAKPLHPVEKAVTQRAAATKQSVSSTKTHIKNTHTHTPPDVRGESDT